MIRGASVSSSLKRCRTLGRPASARQTLWEKSSQETSWRGVSSGWNGVTGRDHDEPQAKNRYNHSVLLLNQRREYHATAQMERAGPALFLGLGAVAATAKAGQYAARAYQEYQASLPTEEELKKQQAADAEKEGAKTSAQDQKGQDANKQEKKADGKRENVFAKFFNLGVGSKYYEGGFESEMTRREAALVLGVRESSSPKRIKEAHRNLLILNHPDTGGSTYIAGKINEAKELLIKGRKAL